MRELPPFRLKALALATAVVCGGVSFNTFAQTNSFALEEVIVTSQKRQQSLQDVPISVAVVQGQKLEEAGVENLEDLTVLLPNIHFTETGISTQVRVRGIGSGNSQGFEQSVGTYVDGIYYGRAQLFRAPLFDLERAEVLRGPQGTLLGKNSIAGGLNLTTAKPTDEFEAHLKASYEPDFNQTEYTGVISGPLSDTFRARLAIRQYEEDGYFYNSFKDQDEAQTDESTVRLSLEWEANRNLKFSLKAERNEFETLGRPIEVTRDVGLVADTNPNDNVALVESDTAPTYVETLALFRQPALEAEQDFVRQTDADEFSDNTIDNITLTADYSLGDHTLTFVTGRVEYDYDETCDCDFTASDIIDLDLKESYEQFSQEIRITSPLGGQIEWLAGLYYQDYDQDFSDRLEVSPTNLLVARSARLADTGLLRDFSQESKSWAIFGQATWNVTDNLHLTLGARYTEEEKSATKSINIFQPSSGDILNDPILGFIYLDGFGVETEQALVDITTVPPSPLNNTGHDVEGSRDESAFIPSFTIAYDLTDEVLLYSSVTKGFKAGGFDPRSNQLGAFASAGGATETNPTQNFEFEDEEALAYEIGFKSSFSGGRGELNGAFYRTDYENLQTSQFDGDIGFNVGNTGEVRVQGLELDGRWRILENLSATYGLSYLDFEFLDFRNGDCNVLQAPDGVDLTGNGELDSCDYTGQRGVYTPELTFNGGLTHEWSLGGSLRLSSALDVQYVDDQQTHNNLDPSGEIDAYTSVGARLALGTDRWGIALVGKNLLDEAITTFSSNAPLASSISAIPDNDIGANTQYSFLRRGRTVVLEGSIYF